MRLAEPIDTSGFFWLPGDPQTLSPGVLRISQLGDITLELMRPFGDPVSGDPHTDVSLELAWGERWDDPERILGLVETHGYVTLEGCLRTDGVLTFGGGLTKGTFRPALALLGFAIQDEAIRFQELRFTVEGLSQWLAQSGIHNKQSYSTNTGAIHYSLPESIVVTPGQGLRLQFDFGIDFPTVSALVTEATIRQTESVLLHSSTLQPFEYFSSIARSVVNFISFALDWPMAVTSFTGYVEVERDGETYKRPIAIYGKVGPQGKEGVEKRSHHPLFTYRDISGNLEAILRNWLDSADNLSNAFNLYFGSWSEDVRYLDVRILWLAQALEVLHRASSPRTRMPESDFAEAVSQVLEDVPQEYRELVEGSLKYANELPFRARVEDLMQPIQSYLGSRSSRRAFVSQAVDTRNYLTHYDSESTPNRAEEPRDMFRLQQKLEGVMQLIILERTGFGTEQMDRIVQENGRLRAKLEIEPSV